MKRNYIRLLLLIGVVLAVALLVYCTNVYQYFSLSAFKDDNHFLKRLITHNYASAVAVYLSIFIILIGLGIPGSAAFTLLGGYMFGALAGGIYAIIGSVVGSLTSFLLFRYVLRSTVQSWYGNRIEKFKNQMTEHGANYVLMLHFATIVPYLVINALAAMSDISLFTFIWTTIVGCLPVVIIYSFAGRQLSYISSLYDIFSPTIIIALLLLMALSFVPILIKRYKNNIELE